MLVVESKSQSEMENQSIFIYLLIRVALIVGIKAIATL